MATELEQLKAQIRDLTERLAHVDKLSCLGQMSAGIAHEINNPVAYVLANLTALSDLLEDLEITPLSEGQRQVLTGAREIVADCATGIERIRRISSDLKTFARIDESTMSRLDVNRVVTIACQLAENEVRHRARLIVKLGKVPMIKGDSGKLTQVVLNLLINAAQAIDGDSAVDHCVRVETLARDGSVIIRVTDTGRGISTENRERIFEPFFTTKLKRGGTGLGLWLVQEMVRLHEGDIRVESEEGAGATFEVRLPSVVQGMRSLNPPEPNASLAASMPMRKRARVLIIDDDPALRRALKRMLSSHHEIVEGEGGQGGIDKLSSGEHFDAVLCDLMMPDVDGLAVYMHIAMNRPELLGRLAFMSGGAFTPRARAFLDEIDQQVVEKPVSREALLRVISGLAECEDDEVAQLRGASK